MFVRVSDCVTDSNNNVYRNIIYAEICEFVIFKIQYRTVTLDTLVKYFTTVSILAAETCIIFITIIMFTGQ